MLRKVLLISLGLLIASCGAQQPVQPDNQPKIVEKLSANIHKYQYTGFRHYGAGLGYSLRYVYQNEKFNFADIYIWPTPSKARQYSHKDIVTAITKSALKDIYYTVKKGYYSNVKIVDKNVFDFSGRILATVKITMLRGNIETISYLFTTEYKGILLKARISMADNDVNRKRNDVPLFVKEIFRQVIRNIEDA